MKAIKTSESPIPATLKSTRIKIALARTAADRTADEAKLAKLQFKKSRKAFKLAKKAAKQARKALKALTQELKTLSAKRVKSRARRKPAKTVAPAPDAAPVSITAPSAAAPTSE